jgi:subtilisin family serine protease
MAAAHIGCGCKQPSVVGAPEVVSYTVVPRARPRPGPEAAAADPAVRRLMEALRAASRGAGPEAAGPRAPDLAELSREVCPLLGEPDPACLRGVREIPTRRLRAPRPGPEAAGTRVLPPEQFLLCLAKPRRVDPAEPLAGMFPRAMAEAGGELRPNVRYAIKAQKEPDPSSDEREAKKLCDAHPDWPLKQIDYAGAIERLLAKRPGQEAGQGVRVVQLDTGFTPSCQLHKVPGQASLVLDAASGYDYFDCRDEPTDPLVRAGLEARQPGHGTGTSTVLVSPHVAPVCNPAEPLRGGAAQRDRVMGIAPAATVIPVRVTDGIILGFPAASKALLELKGASFDARVKALVAGIFHAIEADASVVSISMGGVCADDDVQTKNNEELQRYMTEAEAQGIVIVAAAGQFPLPSFVRRIFLKSYPVTFPGSFPSTVAVAASTLYGTPWSKTSRGPKVDVTAPGFGVFRGKPVLDTDPLEDEVKTGDGTSFSAAITAGVAALWVQYWGKEFLQERFGAATAAAFRFALKRSAQTPLELADRLSAEPYAGAIRSRAPKGGWATGEYGSGLLNVARLLDVDLAAVSRKQVCEKEAERVPSSERAAAAARGAGAVGPFTAHFNRICEGTGVELAPRAREARAR